MTWARFDDGYPINRKVAALSDGAFRLDAEAICWSNREGTDGRIAADELHLIRARATPKQAAELVAKGRWHEPGHQCPHDKCPPPGPTGWVIHDFWEFQPTRAQVLKERASKADRQRRWREGKKGGRDGAVDASRNAPGDALVTPAPSPPRPAPKEGGGGAPAATVARRQAAGAAAAGRKDQNPPASPPEPPPTAGPRRAELAAAAKAAVRARPATARRGRATPGPPPVDLVDNPHYDPAIAAATLGTLPASDNGATPTSEETST